MYLLHKSERLSPFSRYHDDNCKQQPQGAQSAHLHLGSRDQVVLKIKVIYSSGFSEKVTIHIKHFSLCA